MQLDLDKKDIGINLFDSSTNPSCVIFISLIKQPGIIKQVTKSVSKIFGFEKSDLLNKNCDLLMPKYFA